MKKLLASISAASLSFGALVGLFAEPAAASVCLQMTGQGTQADPWQVKTPEDLARIGKSYLSGGCESSFSENHYYKLMNDLVLDNNHDPVNLISNSGFISQFDGNGKSISGMDISKFGDTVPLDEQSYVGLFGQTQYATIKNLKLNGGYVSGKNYVGALAGYMAYSHVENVQVSLSDGVSGDSRVGGLIGQIEGGAVVDSTFMASGAVSATSDFVGGAIGRAAGLNPIKSIGVKVGNVVAGTGKSAGGVIGFMYDVAGSTHITDVAFLGNVTGFGPNGAVIGFVGFGDDGEVNISNAVIRGFLDSTSNNPNGLFVGAVSEDPEFSTAVNISNSFVSFTSVSMTDDGRSIDATIEAAMFANSISLSSLVQEDDNRTLSDIYDVSNQVRRVLKFDDAGQINRITASDLPAGWQAQNLNDYSEGSAAQWLVDTSPTVAANVGLPMPAAIYEMGFFDLCQPGTYGTEGSVPCKFALPGQYVSLSGATAAMNCAAGTFQPNFGSRECLLAEPGKFVADPGSMQAVPCPAGYTSAAGASSCYLIPQSVGSTNPVVTTPPAVTPATVTKVTVKRIGNRVSISMISAKLLVVKLNGKFVVSQQPNKLLKRSVALLKGRNKLEIFEGGKVLKRTNHTR